MNWLRHIVINFLTKNLLKAVTNEDVLLISGKDWYIKKRKLSQDEIISLKEEAISFRESDLYKYIIRDLKYQATLQRFDKAITASDMMFGKAMAYSISQIDLFIENVSNLKL